MEHNNLSNITGEQYTEPHSYNKNSYNKNSYNDTERYTRESQQVNSLKNEKLANYKVNMSTTKQKQLSNITSALVKNCNLAKLIVTKQISEEDINKDHYWYSNDFNNIGGNAVELRYTDFLTNLAAAQTTVDSSTLKVAFLVGESSILSSVPELAQNCDLIIIVDFDILLLKHIDLMLDLFTECKSEADEDKYFAQLHDITSSKMLLPGRLNITEDDLTRTHENAKKGLKEFYAFSSRERFLQVKQALSTTPVVTISMDLFDQKSMQSLADVLKQEKAEVVSINLTNALEYTKPFFDSFDCQQKESLDSINANIKKLPINKNATCFVSNLLVHNRKSWVSKPEQLWQNIDSSIYQRIIELEPNKSWLEIFENYCVKYANETSTDSDYEKLIYTLLMLKNEENLKNLQLNAKNIQKIIANNLPEDKQQRIQSWINSNF